MPPHMKRHMKLQLGQRDSFATLYLELCPDLGDDTFDVDVGRLPVVRLLSLDVVLVLAEFGQFHELSADRLELIVDVVPVLVECLLSGSRHT